MLSSAVFISFLVFFVIGLLIMRLVGAWMLRINDVISELREIKYILKNSNGNPQTSVPPIPPKVEIPTSDQRDFV